MKSMKKFKLLFFLVFINFTASFSQDFKVYNGFDEFKSILHQEDDQVYVINFWATWCRPCVKEMPAFNKLYENYHDKNVEIILVSLDFGKNVQKKVSDFKYRHDIKSKIVILDDPDSNSWINKVNPDWSGAIPATVIYRNVESNFYEKDFEYQELENEVKTFL